MERRESPQERVTHRTMLVLLLAFSIPSPRALASTPQPGQEPATAQEIAQAVRRGRDRLLEQLERLRTRPRKDYPMGRLALAVAALVESGIPPATPAIQAAVRSLRAMPLRKTYSVSCYVFALDSLRRQRPPEGMTGGGLLESLRNAVQWLEQARVPRRGWTYLVPSPGNPTCDLSNTQFAVLALYAGSAAGITVSDAVFAETAAFLRQALVTSPERQIVELLPSRSLESLLGLRPPASPARAQVRPGGWGYRGGPAARVRAAKQLAPGRPGGRAPYPAMTAAAASCLTVALRTRGHEEPALTRPRRRDEAAWHEALLSGCAWIARNFDHFLVDDRNLCYRLYSLEKLGDLAGIDAFNRQDWYGLGAARLLQRQHPDGSFGSSVDTSLALLFLTRSTRALRATAAPTLLTGPTTDDFENEEDSQPALVYIEAAGGFLPAAEILAYAASARHRRLLPVLREVVRNFPPNRETELVPLLAPLWTRRDAITRFARSELRRLTGLDTRERAEVLAWYEKCREIDRLGRNEDLQAHEVRKRMKQESDPVLLSRWVRVAARRNLRGLLPFFLEEIASARKGYRRTLHETLKLWTGATIGTPSRDTPAAWEETVRAWQRWRKNRE